MGRCAPSHPVQASRVYPKTLHALQREGKDQHQYLRETEAHGKEKDQELSPAVSD